MKSSRKVLTVQVKKKENEVYKRINTAVQSETENMQPKRN